MYISPVYNKIILQRIAELQKIDYEELKDQFVNTQDGIVGMPPASFDDAIKTLVDMGFVKIEDDIIVFIQNQA